MTAASALEGRSADARLNVCAAALAGAAAGWTLWMGYLLLRAYGELATPTTKAVMLLVCIAVAAAQCAAGLALLRRRWGGRWLAGGLGALMAIVGLMGSDAVGLLINTAALVLVARTWRFDPREVGAPSDPAGTGNSDSATQAGARADESAQTRRRPVRYTLVFGLVFCALYLPAVLLTRWGGIGGAVLLPGIAAAAAWYVAHSRPAVPGGEGFGASICAAALTATVAASCCSALAWLQVFAISITGPASGGSEADFARLFAEAWVAALLVSWGIQYMLAWAAAAGSGARKT